MPNISNSEQQHFPVLTIYDPAAITPIESAPDVSLVSKVPRIIVMTNMDVGTELAVMVRIDITDSWRTLAVYDGAAGDVQHHEFNPRWNFVQVVRTGAQDVIVRTQN